MEAALSLGVSNVTFQRWRRGSFATRGRGGVVATGQTGRRSARAGLKDVYRGGSGDGRRETRTSSSVELAAHVDTISSVQNPYVKHLVKLRTNADYRTAAGCVVVVGSVPLREICEVVSCENLIQVLLVLEGTSAQAELRPRVERVVYVTEPVLRKVAGVDSALGLHGVGVLALPPSFRSLHDGGHVAANWVASPRRVLVLDGIQDPGNLGTLLRTAAAFAWDGVFMLPGGCDPFNEKALRAARGASFRLPIASGRWSHLQAFADTHKMKLYAADPDPKNTPIAVESDVIAGAAATEALCLVLGSEGQGLSENAHRSCERVSIPMPGDFESLNVAVAGGILLYLLSNKIAVPSVAS